MKLCVITALFAASLSAPVFADAVSPGHNLAILVSVADFSRDTVRQWAINSAPYAAMAAPVVPDSFMIPVKDARRAVETGVSQGASSLAEADAEALAQCEAIRPASLLPCVVVAHVSPN